MIDGGQCYRLDRYKMRLVLLLVLPAMIFILSCGAYTKRDSWQFSIPNIGIVEFKGTTRFIGVTSPHGRLFGGREAFYHFQGNVIVGDKVIQQITFENVVPKEILVRGNEIVIACYSAFSDLGDHLAFYRIFNNANTSKGTGKFLTNPIMLAENIQIERMLNEANEPLYIDEIPIEFLIGQTFTSEINRTLIWVRRILYLLYGHENDKVTECLKAFGQEEPGWFLRVPQEIGGGLGVMEMFGLMDEEKDNKIWAEIIEKELIHFPLEAKNYSRREYAPLYFMSKFKDKYLKIYNRLIKIAKVNNDEDLASDLNMLLKLER